jgi:RNA polymerase sigma factor (sigma-70 family)
MEAKPGNITTMTFPSLQLNQLGVQAHSGVDRQNNDSQRSNKYRTDPRLVEACLRGDCNAWNELIERYQRLVYSIPRQYGLSSADSEDVMQNVFEIVYRRLETLRDHTILSSWIIRITHRATLHFLKKRRNDYELLDETCGVDKGTSAQLEHLETKHLVGEALNRLDSQSRQLMEAFLSDSPPSYVELAKKLDCPVGSIGPTRARAFKKLEAILREMGFSMR